MGDVFTDKQEKCKDCGQEFTITAGEQSFFHSKGYVLPKRCKVCRKKNQLRKMEKIKRQVEGTEQSPSAKQGQRTR